MNPPQNTLAFGAPGIEPRWTSSAKEGVGTAYHTSCRVWFTLSHGIVNEIYYPHVDKPNTRDFQFLISDGETFCHEEKRDLNHQIEYPERDCLFYRLTNSDPDGRYRVVKHVLTDPHLSVLLVHTRLEVFDESLRGKLRLYALLAPHLAGFGAGNSAWCSELGDNELLRAQREDVHLIMACDTGFCRRSVGYVGFSDGWQDLMQNFNMDWEFTAAIDGIIELTGAMVASMSIPWGETKGDQDLGGYHLVWTRDLVHSAMALLATDQTSTPLRALIWLAAIQRTDGSFPQNSWIDGTAYWSGLQLDQVALPILLAWRLHKHDALGLFNPRVMIVRAAAHLMLQGPVTTQDRWEENAGYSPSTLATVIAALACAAEWAKEFGKMDVADFIFAYADWLAAHVEEWTVTTQGELVEGFPRHYIRINPTDPKAPDPHPDPNTAMIQLANGGGLHPARNVVGGDFLHLVRFGIRDANDPVIRDSIEVIDRVIKYDLPQGPCWRRYNHDGYGQKDDGGAFDGTGVGRCWPILTGERGHYELAATRDPKPFITAMENFANQGGMLTEQLWDGPDLPEAHMKRGCPTGAAMPLCWSHAEYISMVRSRHDGICLGCVEPAYQRYVLHPARSDYEIWTLRYPMRRMSRGKILRIIIAAQATVVWSIDGGTRTNLLDAIHESRLNLWFADFRTADWPAGSLFTFTFFWKRDQRWEGRDWQISLLER